MNVLTVYFPLQGTERVAKVLAREFKGDVVELGTDEMVRTEEFVNYFLGENGETQKVNILGPDRDPQDYDFIIIGTPVWSYSNAHPVFTFLKDFDLSGKSVAIFTCSDDGEDDTIERMCALLGRSRIVGKMKFPVDGKDGRLLEKTALDWSYELSLAAKRLDDGKGRTDDGCEGGGDK